MTVFIGIDPGLHGAIAAVGPVTLVHDTPNVKVAKGYNYLTSSMRDLIVALVGASERDAIAFIESGIAMAEQSSSSTFKTGRGLGLWEGLVAGLGVRYELVSPRKWKAAMGLPRAASKGESIVMAQQLFPDMSDQLTLQKHHDRAEALLIAEWGRRRMMRDVNGQVEAKAT